MKKRVISLCIASAIFASLIPISLADEITTKDNTPAKEFEEVSRDSIAVIDYELFKEAEPEASELSDDNDTVYEEVELPNHEKELDKPEEVQTQQDEEIEYLDTSIQLMATGTYYSEWGIWFDADTGTITDADKTISGSLTLPKAINNVKITTIGSNAFEGCTALTEIYIPEGVKELRSDAFRDCTKLKTVSLPDSIETVWQDMFVNCKSLRSFTLPAGIKEMINYGNWFEGCENLTTVTVKEGATTVPRYIFRNANS